MADRNIKNSRVGSHSRDVVYEMEAAQEYCSTGGSHTDDNGRDAYICPGVVQKLSSDRYGDTDSQLEGESADHATTQEKCRTIKVDLGPCSQTSRLTVKQGRG